MKRTIFIFAILMLTFLVGCNPGISKGSLNSNISSTNGESASCISTKPPEHSDPGLSINVDSLEQLAEMRSMLQCTDEELSQYLPSIPGGGARSREDLIGFLNLIDSLSVLEIIDGNIVWISYSPKQDTLTGEKSEGVVFITTKSSNGDWTRIEYVLSVKDVNAEVAKLKSKGEFANSTISDTFQSKDGKINVYSEIKEKHPSYEGDVIKWTLTIDGIFARVVYYTADSSNISTSSVFNNIHVTEMQKKLKQ